MINATELRVRYGETDQMGVAYHANYLVWCEVGRTEFIRALGVSYAEMERQGSLLAVAEASLRYHASARYDDLVRIETRLADVRSRTMTFHYDLHRITSPGAPRGERLATASSMLVSLSAAGRPVALPPAIRDLLASAAKAAD